MNNRLTLKKALETNRLSDFIEQEDSRGTGHVDERELMGAIEAMVKPQCRLHVVPRRRTPTARALRSRAHLNLDCQLRTLHKPRRSIYERPMFLNPIQDSLELHPVPLLRDDRCLATPSSQSLELGAPSNFRFAVQVQPFQGRRAVHR